MLLIDAGAVNGGEKEIDGLKTVDIVSYRPVNPPFPSEEMHWWGDFHGYRSCC